MGKLLKVVKEAYAKYHPDLIVILSCCCSGIIGDDVESIAREADKLVGCRMLALRSEGVGGDFRSGYEDAFKLIMELMASPKKKMKRTINILGARCGPSPTEFNWDMNEVERLLGEIGIKINARIAGGCTVEQIKHAREVELNASWYFDWGQKLGNLMQERFRSFLTARLGSPTALRPLRNGCLAWQHLLAWRQQLLK